MKNKDILTWYNGLTTLRTAGTTRFSARVAFTVIHNLRTLQPIAEDIQASYGEILARYGTPLEEPDQFFIEDMASFNKETKELDEVEVDFPITTIKFSDIEHLELTAQEMDALYPMIQEEEGFNPPFLAFGQL